MFDIPDNVSVDRFDHVGVCDGRPLEDEEEMAYWQMRKEEEEAWEAYQESCAEAEEAGFDTPEEYQEFLSGNWATPEDYYIWKKYQECDLNAELVPA